MRKLQYIEKKKYISINWKKNKKEKENETIKKKSIKKMCSVWKKEGRKAHEAKNREIPKGSKSKAGKKIVFVNQKWVSNK